MGCCWLWGLIVKAQTGLEHCTLDWPQTLRLLSSYLFHLSFGGFISVLLCLVPFWWIDCSLIGFIFIRNKEYSQKWNSGIQHQELSMLWFPILLCIRLIFITLILLFYFIAENHFSASTKKKKKEREKKEFLISLVPVIYKWQLNSSVFAILATWLLSCFLPVWILWTHTHVVAICFISLFYGIQHRTPRTIVLTALWGLNGPMTGVT